MTEQKPASACFHHRQQQTQFLPLSSWVSGEYCLYSSRILCCRIRVLHLPLPRPADVATFSVQDSHAEGANQQRISRPISVQLATPSSSPLIIWPHTAAATTTTIPPRAISTGSHPDNPSLCSFTSILLAARNPTRAARNPPPAPSLSHSFDAALLSGSVRAASPPTSDRPATLSLAA